MLAVALLLISIVFAFLLPNPVPDIERRQARFVARARSHSIPAYMPSTPRLSTPKSRRTTSYGGGRNESPSSPLLSHYGDAITAQLVEEGHANNGQVSGPPDMLRLKTLP